MGADILCRWRRGDAPAGYLLSSRLLVADSPHWLPDYLQQRHADFMVQFFYWLVV